MDWAKWAAGFAAFVIVTLLALQGASALQGRKVDAVLARLENTGPLAREEAIADLEKLAERGLTSPNLIRLIDMAGASSPTDPNYVGTDLLEVLEKYPRPAYVKPLTDAFPRLHPEAKASALRILASIDHKKAAQAYVDLVTKYAGRDTLAPLPTRPYRDSPRHGEILFPALLELGRSQAYAYDIYLLTLEYVQAGALKEQDLAPYADQILGSYRLQKGRMLDLLKSGGPQLLWDEEYQEHRWTMALLLDLMRYVRTPQTEAEVRSALDIPDSRIKLLTVLTLTAWGQSVDPAQTETVAADPETRNWLYQQLGRLKQTARFPAKYRTQAAFAESEMVNWLTYPTELGFPPTAIELVKVSLSPDNNQEEYYLFRFRSDHPDWKADGWMAGVAGPYPRGGAPTIDDLGGTFSEFEPIEKRSPEGHVLFLHGKTRGTGK